MAITATGTFASSSGNPLAALSVTTATAGDLIAVSTLILSGSATVASIANGTADGGGWSLRVRYVHGGGTTIEMWTARVGTPGTDDIDITWSGAGGSFAGVNAKQFTAGLGANTVWALDGTASGQSNAVADTSCEYPSKTAAGSGELYIGFGFGDSQALGAGPTGGVIYNVDSIDNCFVSHVSVSGTLAPVATAAGSTTSASIGMLLTATVAGTSAPAGHASGAGAAHQPTVLKTLTPTLIRQPYTARRRASLY